MSENTHQKFNHEHQGFHIGHGEIFDLVS